MLLLYFIIQATLWICSFIVSEAQDVNIPLAQLDALYDLYNSTNGVHWRWNAFNASRGIPWNFTGNPNPCSDEWQGVNCACGSVRCTVVNLILQNKNLTGTIPKSIGMLEDLLNLNLDRNHLFGSIPNEVFTQLIQINRIQLQVNQLTGTISNEINTLTFLQLLILNHNYLNGTLPENMYSIQNLSSINVNNNRISGTISNNIGQLDKLTTFALRDNFMTGSLPASLSSCTQLYFLELYNNQLTGSIPDSYAQLQNLYFVLLDANYLSGSISSHMVSSWPKLESLYVGLNMFTGPVPHSFNTTKLRFLQMNDNQLTSAIPENLYSIELLAYLNLGENYLTSTISPKVGQLRKLEVYDIDSNFISQTIPSSVGNLSFLLDLVLYNNLLTGTLPSDMLTALPTLETLLLQTNILTGNLDLFSSINQTLLLKRHRQHTLLSNSSGDFNITLSRNSSVIISSIDISANQFTGTIPAAIFTFPALTTFAAVSNCLSGDLPDNICNATGMATLALDGLSTASSCQIPIFPHSAYFSAYLLADSLRISIPPCLYAMPNLQSLHLSGNGISGSIPSDVVIGPRLVDLSLSHNTLTGSIPASIQTNQWKNLDLSYNKLNGLLSPHFSACSAGTTISLEVNRLSGTIPINITQGANIDILQGSFFSCRIGTKTSLPESDKGYEDYDCGSNSFDLSAYIWLGLCVFWVLLLVFIVVQYKSHQSYFLVQYFSHLLSQCVTWCTVFSIQPYANYGHYQESEVYKLGRFISDVRFKTTLISAVLLLALMPIYIALTLHSQTYTYLYAWTAGGMYMSGSTAAYGLLAALTGFLLVLCVLGYSITTASYSAPNDPLDNHHSSGSGNSASTKGSGLRSIDRSGLAAVGTLTSLASLRLSGVFFGTEKPVAGTELTSIERRNDTEAVDDSDVISDDSGSAANTLGTADSRTVVTSNRISGKSMQSTRSKTSSGSSRSGSSRISRRKITKKKHGFYFYARKYAMYFLSFFPAILVNCLVITAVNVGYVLVTLNYRSSVVTFVQILLAAFKLAWNDYCVRKLLTFTINTVQYTASSGGRNSNNSSNSSISSIDRNAASNSQTAKDTAGARLTIIDQDDLQQLRTMYEFKENIVFRTIIVLFNNILTPCVAVALVSVDCFYNIIATPARVDTSYALCYGPFDSYDFCANTIPTFDTSYAPPYTYSYQCSSTVVTNYASMYVYMFSITAFVMPLFYIVLKTAHERLIKYYNEYTARNSSNSKRDSRNIENSDNISENNGEHISEGSGSLKKRTHPVIMQIMLGLYYICDYFLPKQLKPLPESIEDLYSRRSSTASTKSTGTRFSRFSERFFGTPVSATSSGSPASAGSTVSALHGDKNGTGDEESGHKNITAVSHQSTQLHQHSTVFFNKSRFNLKIIATLIVLITFGAIFPPLAVVITISLYSYTLFTQLCIGRLLTLAEKHKDGVRIKQIVETECAGISTQFSQSFGYLLAFASCFYSGFVFDTLGNAHGNYKNSIWILFVMALMPVFFYCVFKLGTIVWKLAVKLARKCGHKSFGRSSSMYSMRDTNGESIVRRSTVAMTTIQREGVNNSVRVKELTSDGGNSSLGTGSGAVELVSVESSIINSNEISSV